MFYDVHAHLTNTQYKNDYNKILNECEKKKVAFFLNGLDYKDNEKILELSKKSNNVFACLGMHPTNKFDKKVIEQMENNKFVAIGEIGLDFKNKIDDSQIDNFKLLLKVAEKLNKPVIVHSRGAHREIVDIVKNYKVNVILHAFFAKKKLINEAELIDNIYFSIPSSIHYDDNLKNMVNSLPLNKLFCETDSPYMWKHGRNSPLNVIKCYEAISKIKRINLKEIEMSIEDNVKRIFLQG